ncbi:MAG: alkaline phosphatase family protein [Myxococcota bacterium]
MSEPERPNPLVRALPVASVGAAIVGWALVVHMPVNPPLIDVTLYTVYVLAYFFVLVVLIGAVGVLAPRWPGDVPFPRWLGTAMSLATPLVLLFYAAGRVAPLLASGAEVEVPERQPAACRVTLLGLDGVDPREVERRVAAGTLPGFARLIEGGAFGPMAVVSPHSPLNWTTIATGHPPEEHGVLAYLSVYLRGTSVQLPFVPWDVVGLVLDGVFRFRQPGAISSNYRRVKAMWELFGEYGLNPLVVNWWASYPAEPVDGIVVSNQAIPWGGLRTQDLELLAETSSIVWPPEEEALVRDRVQTMASEMTGPEVVRMIEAEQGAEYFWARDRIVRDLFDRLSRPEQDFRAVYFQGVDVASHVWTSLVFGENIDEVRDPVVPPAEVERLRAAFVDEAYARIDRLVADRLDRLEDDRCLVVVSDHGWDYDGTSHWGFVDAIFAGYGPAFQPGVRIDDAHMLDVLPTVAALLGLPGSDELPGKVLQSAMASDRVGISSIVPSYGPRGATMSVTAGGDDAEHVELLRQLGYVD